jgi:prefoldin subunit 5
MIRIIAEQIRRLSLSDGTLIEKPKRAMTEVVLEKFKEKKANQEKQRQKIAELSSITEYLRQQQQQLQQQQQSQADGRLYYCLDRSLMECLYIII